MTVYYLTIRMFNLTNKHLMTNHPAWYPLREILPITLSPIREI